MQYSTGRGTYTSTREVEADIHTFLSFRPTYLLYLGSHGIQIHPMLFTTGEDKAEEK